jgi:hypothetical protein
MQARSAPAHEVDVPMTFSSDSGLLRTDACLQVQERRYEETTAWQGFGPSADDSEKAMDALVAVLKRGDRDALLQLSDPDLGRDPKQFEDQAQAYFVQMQRGEIVSIPLAYEFSGFVVFLAEFRWMGRTLSSPFVFHHEKNGTLGFLPYRTDDLTFELLRGWFEGPWGPLPGSHQSYCSQGSMSEFNYRVPTSASQSEPIPYIFLKGAPITQSSDLSSRVTATLQGMKKAINGENWIDRFAVFQSEAGAKRFKEWYQGASKSERDEYKQYVADLAPFFIFDASPLIIVYMRNPPDRVQVVYLIPSGNDLVWTNATRATVTDKLFKLGPLLSAAKLAKPFSSLEVSK